MARSGRLQLRDGRRHFGLDKVFGTGNGLRTTGYLRLRCLEGFSVEMMMMPKGKEVGADE